MSAKQRSRAVDFLVYVAVRVFVCIAQALSFETAAMFARWFAWIIYKFDKRHRLVAVENLQKSFPGQLTDAEIDRLVRHVYLFFCTMVVEILFMPRKLRVHNYKRSIVLVNPCLLADIILRDGPKIIVTGHFGNWEMSAYALAMFGVRLHAIDRPLDNPYVDDFLRAFRERTGQKLLAKSEDIAQIESVVAAAGVLGIVGDQDAGQRGVFVDFFGRPASTHKGMAVLSLQHHAPIIVCGMPRIDGMYRITPIDVIDPADYASVPDAVRVITQRFTAGLERLVRATPEQYFWVHRRWKHAPAKRRTRAAAA